MLGPLFRKFAILKRLSLEICLWCTSPAAISFFFIKLGLFRVLFKGTLLSLLICPFLASKLVVLILFYAPILKDIHSSGILKWEFQMSQIYKAKHQISPLGQSLIVFYSLAWFDSICSLDLLNYITFYFISGWKAPEILTQDVVYNSFSSYCNYHAFSACNHKSFIMSMCLVHPFPLY